MDFVSFPEAAKDRNRVFDAGLMDHYGLEAPFKSRILLDVLAVLVKRRSADAVQLAAGQKRLQQVAGVHGAFGLAGANDGMQFVDEENDLSFGGGYFFKDRLEPFFELATELSAGDEGAHVECDDLLFLNPFGDVAADDAVGKTFGNGRFADAGFADEHRVILGAAREDLNDPADLFIAADDRVKLVELGKLRQVTAVLFERFVGGLGILRRHSLGAANFFKGGLNAGAREAELSEQFAGGAVVAGVGQEQVFDRDVVVLQLLGFGLGVSDDFGKARRDVEGLGRWGIGDFWEFVELLDDAVRESIERDVCPFQERRDKALVLAKERGEEVFRVELVVRILDSDGLSGAEGVL